MKVGALMSTWKLWCAIGLIAAFHLLVVGALVRLVRWWVVASVLTTILLWTMAVLAAIIVGLLLVSIVSMVQDT
jgi:hypothetical protein